jgi:Fe-S-cluster containining protein
MMEFTCDNCGFCCTDQATQINLSLLDIKWLSDYLNMSVKTLFDKKIVDFIPFIRTDDLSLFDIELGLKKPCPLYDGKLCKAYPARPMNCRTFPYWLINHKIPDDLKCIQGVQSTKNYKEYERIVGKLLISESEKTEKFLKKIGARQRIALSKNKDFKKIEEKFERAKNKDEMMEITGEMMSFSSRYVDKKVYEKIVLIDKKIKKQSFDEKIDELIKAEELIM